MKKSTIFALHFLTIKAEKHAESVRNNIHSHARVVR